MASTASASLTERQSLALATVRDLIGGLEYDPMQDRWERAAREDVVALEKAVADLRRARTRSAIRSEAAWLWRAFVAQRTLQVKHEESRA